MMKKLLLLLYFAATITFVMSDCSCQRKSPMSIGGIHIGDDSIMAVRMMRERYRNVTNEHVPRLETEGDSLGYTLPDGERFYIWLSRGKVVAVKFRNPILKAEEVDISIQGVKYGKADTINFTDGRCVFVSDGNGEYALLDKLKKRERDDTFKRN